MTELSVMPKMQLITPDMVKASVKRARRSLEAAAKEIVWQIEVEGWRNLDYRSWDAMRIGEYGGAAFMVPSKSRPEIIARIRATGLTQKEIADTAGVTQQTVSNDLNTNFGNEDSAPIINSRGQQRPATYQRAEPDDDVVDAEVVEDDDTPNTPTDPAPAEPVNTITCPTCNGTGKVTP